MTSKEAYFDFQLLLNKNGELSNVKVSEAKYVFLFNRITSTELKKFINNSTIHVHDIQELLLKDELLSPVKSEDNYTSYRIPSNYYEFVDSYSVTSQGKCKSKTINYLYKPRDSKLKISEDSYISFDHEESLCDLSENKLIVYKKDYEIDVTYLSYYKKVDSIDIEGYQNTLTGEFSTNVNPTISDYLVRIFNNLVVEEIAREFEDMNKLNLSKTRN